MLKETANYIGLDTENVILKGNAVFIQNGLEICRWHLRPIWPQSWNTTPIKSGKSPKFAYDFVTSQQE
jgi:hypothetical protein